MNISSARIRRAKATGYFVLLRNLIFLILSAVAFFIKRSVISLVYFIIGGCIDLYLLFSIFIIIKLFEGLNHNIPANLLWFSIDLGCSSLLYIGLIAYTIFYCVNYSYTHDQCYHSYTSCFMAILGVLIIINFVIYLIIRGLKKRMVFGIELDKRIATHRSTTTSLDGYFQRNHRAIESVDSFRSENPTDVVAGMPSARERPNDHNYINLGMSSARAKPDDHNYINLITHNSR